jgi:hypothetical protein
VYVSKHFRLAEFVKVEEGRCIGRSDEPYVYAAGGDYYFRYVRLNPKLVDKLEKLRGIFGKPLLIQEGYRPPKYNKCVGGKGPHTRGIAVDLSQQGYYFDRQGKPRFTRFGRIANNRFSDGGRGFGPTTTHLDTGNSRRWCYGLTKRQCKRLR